MPNDQEQRKKELAAEIMERLRLQHEQQIGNIFGAPPPGAPPELGHGYAIEQAASPHARSDDLFAESLYSQVEKRRSINKRLSDTQIEAAAQADDEYEDNPLKTLNRYREQAGQPLLSEAPPSPQGFFAGVGSEMGAQSVPLVGMGIQAVDVAQVIAAANRVAEGQGSNEDLELIAEHQEKMVSRGRPAGGLGEVGRIVGGSAGFAADMAATGGLAAIAKGGLKIGARKVAGEVVEKAVQKSLASRVGAATGRLAGRAATTTALMPARVAASVAERQLPITFLDPETNKYIVDMPDEEFLVSLGKGGLDVYTEVLSERLGSVLPSVRVPFISKIAEKLGASRFTEAIASYGGIHGPIAEVGEEFAKAAMDDVLGIRDDPYPSLEEVGTEMVPAFTIMQGAGVGAGLTLSKGNAVRQRMVEWIAGRSREDVERVAESDPTRKSFSDAGLKEVAQSGPEREVARAVAREATKSYAEKSHASAAAETPDQSAVISPSGRPPQPAVGGAPSPGPPPAVSPSDAIKELERLAKWGSTPEKREAAGLRLKELGAAIQDPSGAAPAPVRKKGPRKAAKRTQVPGRMTRVEAAGLREPVPAAYAVVELADLQASHDMTSGVPTANPQYPESLQPRGYEQGGVEHMQVIDHAQKGIPAFWVSDHPGAAEGPPSVTPDGTVINGNGRTMSLQYAAGQGNIGWYRDELEAKADQFGIDTAALAEMKNPVLVRVVDMDAKSNEARRFARGGNIPNTAMQSPVRTAASLRGLVSPEIIEDMEIGEADTFSQAVGATAQGKRFRKNLKAALSREAPGVLPEIFGEGDVLTAQGIELVRNMMLSSVLPVEVIESMAGTPGVARSVERAVPQLLKMKADYPEVNVGPQLIEALQFKARNPEAKSPGLVDEVIDQQGMFGVQEELSPGARMLVDFLNEFGSKPKQFADRLGAMMLGAAETQGLLAGLEGAVGIEEMASEVLGVPVRENAEFGVLDELMAKADAEIDNQGLGVTYNMGPNPFGPPKFREDRVPGIEAVAPSIPQEVRERFEASQQTRKSIWSKVPEWIRNLKAKVVRAQEHLDPKDQEFTTANEHFRNLKDIPENVVEDAQNTVSTIIDPLGPRQYEIFRWKVVLDNMVASANAGHAALRFGFENLDQVLQARSEIDATIARVPEIQEALKARKKVNRELVQQAVELGVLPVEVMQNTDAYFHQQVLSHLEMDKFGQRMRSGVGPRKVTRSFQKKRRSGEADELTHSKDYDYNTDYIQAETSWMKDLLFEVRKEEWRRSLAKHYDLMPHLKGQARHANRLLAIKDIADARGMTPEALWERILELRAAVKASAEGPDANESDMKAIRAALLDELSEIDPFRPWRMNMARAIDHVQRASLSGLSLDASEVDSIDDVEFAPMEVLGKMAAQETDAEEGTEWDDLSTIDQARIMAKSFFKNLGEMNTFIREKAGENFRTWDDFMPDDHDVWQAQPGNYLFSAPTIPMQIAERLESEAIKSHELTADQIRMVAVLGGKKPQMVVPIPLRDQLEDTTKKKTSSPIGWREAMKGWKVWTLLNPKRALPYMIRNVTGDLDPTIVTEPAIAKETPAAFNELKRRYQGAVGMSPELRAARDFGVISSSATAQEIGELEDLQLFERFYSKSGARQSKLNPLFWGEKWFDLAKGVNELRENTLRYAAFKHYRKQLKAGKVVNYGASRAETVQRIQKDMGLDAAAAHMARNLLGDYGNLTVMGTWLRQNLMPFWAFQEVNGKRYSRLALNNWEQGQVAGKGNAMIAGAVAAALTAKLAWMYGAMWAWNNLMRGDEEEDLGQYDKSNPRITIGRTENGAVKVFRNAGALGEVLEWFGVNTALGLMGQVKDGQISAGDLFAEMAKDPLNKLVGGVGPQVKMPVEMLMGQSVFPDVLNPRATARDEVPFNVMGLGDEYQAVRGWVLKDGSRMRPNYLTRMMTGVVDPRKNAIGEMYDLQRKFRRSRGEPEGAPPRAQSRARKMKFALMNNDFTAFREARGRYIDTGNDYANWQGTLRYLDPVGPQMNDDDEAAFEAWMSDRQRIKLRVARDYAHELQIQGWQWWQDAAAFDDADRAARAGTAAGRASEARVKSAKIAAPPPRKGSPEEKWSRWRDDRRAALQWAHERGMTAQELRQGLLEHISRFRDPKTKRNYLQRLRYQMHTHNFLPTSEPKPKIKPRKAG